MDTEHLTVAELMTPDPCGVDERLRLGDALDRMLANNIRHLVVLRDDAKLAGVVALEDIYVTNAVLGPRADNASIRSAMRPAFTCTPDTPVGDVASAMEARRCDCAVVVDADGERVIGIFTITDALRAVRQLDEGRLVEPEVMPTHNRAPYEPRQTTTRLPSSASSIVAQHHASPRTTVGLGRILPT